MTTDGTADETAIEAAETGVEDGAAVESAADDDGGPPYSRLDEATAAKCGLWQE